MIKKILYYTIMTVIKFMIMFLVTYYWIEDRNLKKSFTTSIIIITIITIIYIKNDYEKTKTNKKVI
jgi:hypothetical protein